MREKYESLPLVQLKALAKVRGLKGTSTMKKADLVDAMLIADRYDEKVKDEQDQTPTKAQEPVQTQEQAQTKAPEAEEKKETAAADTATSSDSESKEEAKVAESPPEKSGKEATESAAQTSSLPKAPAPTPGKPINFSGKSSNSGQSSSYDKKEGKKPFRVTEVYDEHQYPKELDSGEVASGILEVMPDGYGFIRCENYLPGENDVYVAPSQIRKFGLKTGDILIGNKRIKTQQEKFSALLFIRTVNGYTTEESAKRMNFEDMTPIFPNERVKLETQGCSIAMRVMDLICPVGKGQRGMIVSPPKAGKTTLIKDVARSILRTNPKMHMIILLIDERPEEVTDIK
jgi:transcription termination factor Rho